MSTQILFSNRTRRAGTSRKEVQSGSLDYVVPVSGQRREVPWCSPGRAKMGRRRSPVAGAARRATTMGSMATQCFAGYARLVRRRDGPGRRHPADTAIQWNSLAKAAALSGIRPDQVTSPRSKTPAVLSPRPTPGAANPKPVARPLRGLVRAWNPTRDRSHRRECIVPNGTQPGRPHRARDHQVRSRDRSRGRVPRSRGRRPTPARARRRARADREGRAHAPSLRRGG